MGKHRTNEEHTTLQTEMAQTMMGVANTRPAGVPSWRNLSTTLVCPTGCTTEYTAKPASNSGKRKKKNIKVDPKAFDARVLKRKQRVAAVMNGCQSSGKATPTRMAKDMPGVNQFRH